MLWCWPEANVMIIIGFDVCKVCKIVAGWYQGNTCENSFKMTTSEVVLWCSPDNKLVKPLILRFFARVVKCDLLSTSMPIMKMTSY